MQNLREGGKWLIDANLIARPISFEDTPDIVRWRNQPEVKRYFIYQKPFTIESHNEWMKNSVITGKVKQFIVETMPNQLSIGSVYLRDINMAERTAEYGVFIGEKTAIHHGYGTKMVKWITEYAKEELHLNYIIGRIYADNIASLSAAKRAGFKETKKIYKYVQIDGVWKDIGFLKKDFSQTRRIN